MEREMNGPRELGSSLPVQNVQDLASKENKEIPKRYIRPEFESDVVSIDESREIPVIDLSKLLDEQFNHDELAKLHSACQDWGFFQLINHGASKDIIGKMKFVLQEFFDLALEEKLLYSQPPNSLEGYGQAFVVSEEQKLDWSDMFYLTSLPVNERNMMLWPNKPTSFRETLEKYSSEMERVTNCLICLMAKNLGVEPEKLGNMCMNGYQGIRMNYYPHCPHADKVIGISPHSDGGFLTLLLQVNEVEGLQIRKSGKWVPIKPILGTIIVNIGDAFEIISNGKYKSIEHRAVIHPKKERMSIAAFHTPNVSATIGPLADLVKEDGENYKTIIYEDYVKRKFASKLDGKSALDFLKFHK